MVSSRFLLFLWGLSTVFFLWVHSGYVKDLLGMLMAH